jgi:hypothetical protein
VLVVSGGEGRNPEEREEDGGEEDVGGVEEGEVKGRDVVRAEAVDEEEEAIEDESVEEEVEVECPGERVEKLLDVSREVREEEPEGGQEGVCSERRTVEVVGREGVVGLEGGMVIEGEE